MIWLVTPLSATMGDERPNIVFVLSDDQNWHGLSAAMHPDVANSKSDVIETPNLEKLAAQGMPFSAAYAPASVCAPTRISLQTGKSRPRDGSARHDQLTPLPAQQRSW